MIVGGFFRKVERAIYSCPRMSGELVVDDLHHLLRRIQRFGNLGAQCAVAYARGERTHHVERDVGVEQRAADFADRAVDIRVGKLALALEMLECIRETIC